MIDTCTHRRFRQWFAILVVLGAAFTLLWVSFSLVNASLAAAPELDTRAEPEWDIQTVDSRGCLYERTSLDLDKDGYPHIIYSCYPGKYAYQDASGWYTTTYTEYGYDAAMVLGPDDLPRVCIRHFTQMDYGYLDAEGWHFEFTFGYLTNESYCSIAQDADGNPGFSFYDRDIISRLVYAFPTSAGWDFEFVPDDVPLHRGSYNSLAYDGDGYPHISYYHSTNSALKYAYQTSDGWHFETLDDENRTGSHTSLALDDNGYAHISYFHCGTLNDNGCIDKDLRYAHQDSGGWYTETVDSPGEVGMYTSIDLDKNGYPHISYLDLGNVDLKYAYKDESGWHIETVDSEGEVGEHTSLALGDNGSIHISYLDYTNSTLKYAFLEGEEVIPNNVIYLPVTIKG